jgi:hypothetical protein
MGTSLLSSIEIMRKSIKSKLQDFAFETSQAEVDFLRHHSDILKLLPELGASLKQHFGADSKLILELMDEGPAWQTLFINVYARCDWASARRFMDAFLEKIFNSYPDVAEKINVSINSYDV